MSVQVNVTPELLAWARDISGITSQVVAKRLKITKQKLAAWESGLARPTYAQLERLALLYHRPTAVFFFPEPPEEAPISVNLRTLPKDYAEKLSPEVRYLIRKATARRLHLYEIYGESTPDDIQRFRTEVERLDRSNAKILAQRVRDIIGVSLDEQYKWETNDQALKQWRSALEMFGIWIFKDAFKDDDYCGFYLHDDTFPIIYLNNSMPASRQIFTLFHELGHLLLNDGGIDFRRNVEHEFPRDHQRDEVFCNAFAGAFLVPDGSLDITERPEEWYQEWEQKQKTRKEKGKGGGNYYATQMAYLGDKYLQLAFRQYYQQRIDEYRLADYLDVKPEALDTLEGYMLQQIT